MDMHAVPLKFLLKVLPSQPVRLSAAAGILFQVNAAWLVWKSTAVPDHKAPDVVHFKTPAYL
jgi:hypothetical protein